MHHLLAFSGSVAQNAVAANIPAISDEYWTQLASGYQSQSGQKILRAYVRADAATIINYDSPNLRVIGPPNVWPFDTAAAVPDNPPLIRYDDYGMTVPPLDTLNVQVTRAGAGASDCQALLWTGPTMPRQVSGQARPTRWTAAITRVANQWVSGAITPTQSLPSGRYAIVGMAAFGTNLLCARLIFPTGGPRPGVLAQQAVGEYDQQDFRYGRFGLLGEFESTAPPTLQILGYGANTAQVVFLDLVPLSLR